MADLAEIKRNYDYIINIIYLITLPFLLSSTHFSLQSYLPPLNNFCLVSSSFSGEYGPAQAWLCVAWVMDLTLRRPGFDFASTPGFWLCVNPIHPHHLGVLHCLRSSFSKFFYLFLRESDLKSASQLTFFQPRLCPLSLRSTTFFLVSGSFSGEYGWLKLDFASLVLWTRLCVVQGLTLRRSHPSSSLGCPSLA
jgi:hypothetical protein